MAATWNATINLKTAGRGSAGTTMIAGAVRARVNFNLEKVTSRGGNSSVPDDVRVLGGVPQIQVETESFGAMINSHAQASLNVKEILKLTFTESDADHVLTVDGVKFVAGGPSEFPPREGTRRAQVHMLTFDVIQPIVGAEKRLDEIFVYT